MNRTQRFHYYTLSAIYVLEAVASLWLAHAGELTCVAVALVYLHLARVDARHDRKL